MNLQLSEIEFGNLFKLATSKRSDGKASLEDFRLVLGSHTVIFFETFESRNKKKLMFFKQGRQTNMNLNSSPQETEKYAPVAV